MLDVVRLGSFNLSYTYYTMNQSINQLPGLQVASQPLTDSDRRTTAVCFYTQKEKQKAKGMSRHWASKPAGRGKGKPRPCLFFLTHGPIPIRRRATTFLISFRCLYSHCPPLSYTPTTCLPAHLSLCSSL